MDEAVNVGTCLEIHGDVCNLESSGAFTCCLDDTSVVDDVRALREAETNADGVLARNIDRAGVVDRGRTFGVLILPRNHAEGVLAFGFDQVVVDDSVALNSAHARDLDTVLGLDINLAVIGGSKLIKVA